METAKHAPTLWKIHETDFFEVIGFEIIDDASQTMAICPFEQLCGDEKGITKEAAKAHAARIVQACNSHDKLVEALGKIAAVPLPGEPQALSLTSSDVQRMIRIARAALAQVGKEG